jgi:hypothetical protein
MKASQLDRNMFPRREVIEAYKSVGQGYDLTVQDRVWEQWIALVQSDACKNQEIEQKISALYRVKDSKGEWLFGSVHLTI